MAGMNWKLKGKFAVLIRGSPSTGKSSIREELAKTLQAGQLNVKQVVLDKYEPEPVNNDAPRTYPALDSIGEDCVLLELGYGGFATKHPEGWRNKLIAKGFTKLYLIRLCASLQTVKSRTAQRTDGMKEGDATQVWKRYDTEEESSSFP